MSITIRVKDQTPELLQKMEAALGRFVTRGVLHINRGLQTAIGAPKSGKEYKRGKEGVHIASAPGEAPANDSSNLAVSISVLMASTLEAKIGTPVEYALNLETGTKHMGPRPLWERTARESMPTLENILQEEIAKAQNAL